MANDAQETLRYPIGRFAYDGSGGTAARRARLERLAALPGELARAVAGLDDAQLDTPYREGGWTVRQVVHHVADSHLNSYLRFRWALTEEAPTIKPYDEKAWAELADARRGPVAPSLTLLEALHARWTTLLDALDEAAWSRRFVHPETGRSSDLERTLALYAWHGRHHAQQILALRRRRGW